MNTTPSRRSVLQGTTLGLGGLLLAGCTAPSGEPQAPATGSSGPSATPSSPGLAPAPITLAGLACLARAEGTQLRLHTATGDLLFWAGARLTGFLPGNEAAELRGTAAHYRRWFKGMRDFGIRFVYLDRVHPPAAYAELAALNQQTPASPLYLVQGITLPLRENTDLHTDETDAMRAEMGRAVRAVTGTGENHAVDVSAWTAAWTLDIGWTPERIAATDDARADAEAHTGTYVSSDAEATPTQHWFAARLDELAELLATRDLSVPLAVVDRPGIVSMEGVVDSPLTNRAADRAAEQAGDQAEEQEAAAAGDEPVPGAADASADPSAHPARIHAEPAWPGGVFSFTDAPPYLPDYAAADPAYGHSADPYLAYLTDRAQKDGTPVLVGSYNVTSALGSGFPGSADRSHGNHNEVEKFDIESRLVTALAERGFSGAFLGHWLDDWSRTTWNTQTRAQFAGRHEGPIIDHDPLTADQWGGVMAVEARRHGERVVHEAPENELARVLVDHDASWLYLTLEFSARVVSPVEIGFDMLAGGGLRLPGGSGEPIHDVAVRTVPTMSTTYLFVRGVLDPLRIDGVPMPAIPSGNNRGWHMQRLLQSTTSGTDETRTTSLSFLDVGDLRLGDWDPSAPDFDSRAGWHLAREGAGTPARLRYRLPWGLLNMLDAPNRRALTFVKATPTLITTRAVRVTVESTTPGSPIDFSVPLPTWETVRYGERMKQGADTLGQALRAMDERLEQRATASPTPGTGAPSSSS